jgi:hypothetical protein
MAHVFLKSTMGGFDRPGGGWQGVEKLLRGDAAALDTVKNAGP